MKETVIPPTSPQNNKRIAKNTLMLYFRMILTMLVTLYTSRVILNTLGVEDYGIYNVVGGVVTSLSFFNGAMSAATQRFLSYEIGKKNFQKLKQTFNATLIIHFGLALLIFILAETVGLWLVKNLLQLPIERMDAAIYVYHFSMFSFMISIIQTPYNATIIAHERMNVYAYVSLIEVALKLLIVFILIYIPFDKLKLYGVLLFIVTFITTTVYRVYTSKHFSETKFELVTDKKLYQTLIGYSVWSLFGNIALVSKNQGIIIISNIFFGPIINAAQSIANQIQIVLNSFVNNFQIAVKPQIIKSYAINDKKYMFSLIIQSAKFSFFLMLLLSLPLILELDLILELWLNNVPKYTSIFTVLNIIVILIDCISGPLVTAVQATGKIKKYQIAIGSLLFLNLPLSYGYFKLGYPPESTLYINIIITILVLITRLLFIKTILDFPIFDFLKKIILKNLMILVLSFSLPVFIQYFIETSIARLLLIVCISFFWTGLIIFTVGLNKTEKSFIVKNIKLFIKNKAKDFPSV